jgi:hypothetical protein
MVLPSQPGGAVRMLGGIWEIIFPQRARVGRGLEGVGAGERCRAGAGALALRAAAQIGAGTPPLMARAFMGRGEVDAVGSAGWLPRRFRSSLALPAVRVGLPSSGSLTGCVPGAGSPVAGEEAGAARAPQTAAVFRIAVAVSAAVWALRGSVELGTRSGPAPA